MYAAVKAQNPEWSQREIGSYLGVSEAAVRRAFEKLRVKEQLPDLNPFELAAPLELDGDWCVTADWHIPITDWPYVNRMVEDAEDAGLKNLLIAGDLCNMDSLSRFDPKQQTAGLQAERYAAQKAIDHVLQRFERVVYSWGNHDDRLLRALGFKLEFEHAMAMFVGADLADGLELTGLDHVWLTEDNPYNGLGTYVCHPQAYTRIPLSGARRIAAKMNANVMVAHSHHAAIGYAEDGEKVVVEVGGMFDRYRTAYLQRSTTYPTWAQGYVLYRNGLATLRSPGIG